jgi:uncharacterized protein (DUF4415 family)
MSKKSFIDDVKTDYNPAQAFISPQPLKDKEAIEAELKAERERRSKPRLEKRLNLLTTEKLHKDLQDLSRYDGRSVNSIINDALADYLETRKNDIEKIRSL